MTPTSNHDTAPDPPNQPFTNTDTTPSSVLFAASLQGPPTLLDTQIGAQLARYAEEVLTLNLSGHGDRIEPPNVVLAALELPEETRATSLAMVEKWYSMEDGSEEKQSAELEVLKMMVELLEEGRVAAGEELGYVVTKE